MTELAITVDGFVNVFKLKLKPRGRRYACPACGLDFDIIEYRGVSGHCRNKSCRIYGYGRRGVGWAHLIGARIWECSEAEAIERVLRVCPSAQTTKTVKRDKRSSRKRREAVDWLKEWLAA